MSRISPSAPPPNCLTNADPALHSKIAALSNSNTPVLSIVSPVYCEGSGVGAFVRAVEVELTPLGLPYEIVLVDDGSSDDSWEHMTREAQNRPFLHCLRLSRNFGKEAAMVAGIEAARGQAVITLDSDLQHPVSIIPRMVDIWLRGEADVVEAQKERRQSESTVSRLLAGLFYTLFAAVSPFDLTNASDFKLMDRKVVSAWESLGERRIFFRGMSRWVGFRRSIVLFPPADRHLGLSKWSFLSKLVLALDSLSAYTAKPLSLIWGMGGFFALFAIIMASEALWTKFQGNAVSGFTTLILLVLITGTCIFAAICLLSLYVSQIFHEVKGRPRYLVSEYLNEPADLSPQAKNAYFAPRNAPRAVQHTAGTVPHGAKPTYRPLVQPGHRNAVSSPASRARINAAKASCHKLPRPNRKDA